MSSKTEYGYNEDDFVEKIEGLEELTVTITLCEYRNLITENVRYEKYTEMLQEENKDLKSKVESLSQYIAAKNPQWLKTLTDAVKQMSAEEDELQEVEEDA